MGRLCYRRKHRSRSWYFSHKAVTVQGGYGALFAVRVQIFLSITRVAVQVWSEPLILSPFTKLVAGTGAVSRYKLSRSKKAVKVQKTLLWADARVRVQRPLQICLECRSKAKSVTNNLPILSVLAEGVVKNCEQFNLKSSLNSYNIIQQCQGNGSAIDTITMR